VPIALGVAAFASVISLALFFIVGGPFGTINDLGNALVGILSALAAWTLRPRGVDAPSWAATISLAVLGAAITVVGSALVVSGTTGFFLAGLVSSVGFAFVGLWLVAVNRSMASDGRWPRGLVRLGLVAGAIMAVGFATAPGVVMGLDDMDAAPGWIWIGYAGWMGTFILFPAWAIWLGRMPVGGATSLATKRRTL
jgi:hypothetical protein